MSQRIRKRNEEGFGWIKVTAGQRKTRFRGRDKVGWGFAFAAGSYKLVRLHNCRSRGVSVLSRWRIVELPGYMHEYADLVEPAFILFKRGRGEFAFGTVTGAFANGCDHDAVEFDWDGNDEIDQVRGSGWGIPTRRIARRRDPLPRRRRDTLHRPTMSDFFNSLLENVHAGWAEKR